MNIEDSNKRLLEFRKALKSIFKGNDGKKVLEFLKESYVENSCVDTSPEITYYRLGQKEFVQGLMKDVDSDIKELEALIKGVKS